MRKVWIDPDILARQEEDRQRRLAIVTNPKQFTLEYIKKKEDEYNKQAASRVAVG